MAKRKANEWQIRAVKAESENTRLARDLKAAREEAQQLRRRMGWQEHLTPDQNRTVVAYLTSLKHLAEDSSANQAIRTDRSKVSGSRKSQPMPSFRPVWAHNLLGHHIDQLHQLHLDIESWFNYPAEVTRHRARCRRCRHELDQSVRALRFCPNCGLDRRPPREESA